ncbi:Small subunit processome component [Tieghemiomyces parasiticus]|uniref:Small subunit processome component n=1 Tax=Tieghemiomyces parasiticus TaxID=78921 RepID=A0A9W8AKE7_9FUNG|nr:Small subunit processome component [Tieghemiomyces parasiticus]
MGPKRTRAYHKAAGMYKTWFGFHEPYQVIALRLKINLRDELPKIFNGTVSVQVPTCLLHRLEKQGDKKLGELIAARRFEKWYCPHQIGRTETNCIIDCIGTHNKNRLAVAAQDANLRKRLRRVPSVPLLHINSYSILILEPMSEATTAAIKAKARTVGHAHAAELKLLDALLPEVKAKREGAADLVLSGEPEATQNADEQNQEEESPSEPEPEPSVQPTKRPAEGADEVTNEPADKRESKRVRRTKKSKVPAEETAT